MTRGAGLGGRPLWPRGLVGLKVGLRARVDEEKSRVPVNREFPVVEVAA